MAKPKQKFASFTYDANTNLYWPVGSHYRYNLPADILQRPRHGEFYVEAQAKWTRHYDYVLKQYTPVDVFWFPHQLIVDKPTFDGNTARNTGDTLVALTLPTYRLVVYMQAPTFVTLVTKTETKKGAFQDDVTLNFRKRMTNKGFLVEPA